MKVSQTNAATVFITKLQDFYGEATVMLALRKICEKNSPERQVGQRLLKSIDQMKPISEQDKQCIERVVLRVFEANRALLN